MLLALKWGFDLESVKEAGIKSQQIGYLNSNSATLSDLDLAHFFSYLWFLCLSDEDEKNP